MKNFLKRISIFLSAIAITCVIVEVMLRQIPNDYKLKSDLLRTNSDDVEVLVLGGSHSLFGINPVYMGMKGFNSSNPSQSLDYDLAILKKYRNNWSSLKFVVIPLSYSSLFEDLNGITESWRIKNYIIYYRIRDIKHPKYHAEIFNGPLLTQFYRLYNYYYKKVDYVQCTEFGWNASYSSVSQQNLIKSGIDASKRHTVRDKSKFNKMSENLVSIVSFLDDYNCNLLLFTPPAYKSYRENLDKELLNQTIETGNRFAREFNNCYYINLLNDSTFLDKDYYDADHMNEIGAKKLTQKIDSIINDIVSNNYSK